VSAQLLALLIAGLSGVTMAFQGAINSGLSLIIGLLQATFVVHIVGLALVTALLFLFGAGWGFTAKLSQAPWYSYLGGVLGVAIVYGVMRAMPKVGVAPATTAIIIGQVLTAAVIDHMGWFGLQKIPFSWCRVAGALLMAGGAFLLLKK